LHKVLAAIIFLMSPGDKDLSPSDHPSSESLQRAPELDVG